jgi:hypothetical protein
MHRHCHVAAPTASFVVAVKGNDPPIPHQPPDGYLQGGQLVRVVGFKDYGGDVLQKHMFIRA